MTTMINFFFNDNKTKVHHEAFPENFRMLIVGQSGNGKTTLLMQLLLTPNLLNYDELYIFPRWLHQPEYQCLIEGFKNKLHKSDILNMLNVGHLIKKTNFSIEELALELRLDNDEHGIEPLCEQVTNTPLLRPNVTDLSLPHFSLPNVTEAAAPAHLWPLRTCAI